MSTKIKRKLYTWEIQEFSPIFENSIHLDRVLILEHDPIPDYIDRIGRLIKRTDPPKSGEHNAITWGNNCHFPVGLPNSLLPVMDPESYKLPWLLHELTHTWQFQHMSWFYLIKSLWAHAKHGNKVYDYGGEQGLTQRRAKGFKLFDFNLEQQATIVQHYYTKHRKIIDTEAYLPYIDDMRSLE